MVIGRIALRDQSRVGELVEGVFLEADRERAQRLRALLLRERRQQAGVDPAGEEHAHGNVAHEVCPD